MDEIDTEETPPDLWQLARDFLFEAFEFLSEEHLIPRPRWKTTIRVGTDYYGPDLMGRPAFDAFEKALETTYPHRVKRPLSDKVPEYANHYLFVLLETCVSGLAIRDEGYSSDNSAVNEAIGDLISTLETEQYELVCCRVISHMRTAGNATVEVGRYTIMPQLEPIWQNSPLTAITKMVPAAKRAFQYDPPFNYDPPTAIVSVRIVSSEEPHKIAGQLSGQIERFLLLTRLIYGATSQSHWQIAGATTSIARIDPQGTAFAKQGFGPSFIQRVTTLNGSEGGAIEALNRLLQNTEVARDGKLTTSFDMALDRFTRSYKNEDLFDCIVDLATALEAILLGGSKSNDEIGLRLKTRAAALLTTDEDPGRRIFEDIGLLYGIRSNLVHGGSLKRAELEKSLKRLVPTYGTSMFGVNFALAIDRFRDIVRRAILARLALADGLPPLWPIDGDTPVDAILADEETRQLWRSTWRGKITSMGLTNAVDQAPAAVDSLGQNHGNEN